MTSWDKKVYILNTIQNKSHKITSTIILQASWYQSKQHSENYSELKHLEKYLQNHFINHIVDNLIDQTSPTNQRDKTLVSNSTISSSIFNQHFHLNVIHFYHFFHFSFSPLKEINRVSSVFSGDTFVFISRASIIS